MPILLSTILMTTSFAQLQTFSIQQGTLMNTKIGNSPFPPPQSPWFPSFSCPFWFPSTNLSSSQLYVNHRSSKRYNSSPKGGVWACFICHFNGNCGCNRSETKTRTYSSQPCHKPILAFISLCNIWDCWYVYSCWSYGVLYSEPPACIRSLSTSFSFLSLSFGYFLSSAFVGLLNLLTGKLTKSKRGWLEGRDMNKNHVELFYWFLGILSVLNFANYVFWAKWY